MQDKTIKSGYSEIKSTKLLPSKCLGYMVHESIGMYLLYLGNIIEKTENQEYRASYHRHSATTCLNILALSLLWLSTL